MKNSHLFTKYLLILLLANFKIYASSFEDGLSSKIERTGFIRNAGQVYDMKGALCPDVLYSLQLNNMSVFITKAGLTWAIATTGEKPRNYIEGTYDRLISQPEFVYKEVGRLDINLKGANIRKENCVEEQWDEENGVVNFYAGGLTDEALNIRYCTNLRIKDIYPGIDWILKLDSEKGFKADYFVKPGADVGNIKLQILGASSVKLNEKNNIIYINTPMESFQIGKLICFNEDGAPVNSKYLFIEDDMIVIETEGYYHSKSLLIDPFVNISRAWATYFGGNGNDFMKATRPDLVMNKLYFVGYSYTIAFPPLFNNGTSYYTSNAGYPSTADAFILRTSLTGVREWCSYVFSTGNDLCNSVTTDNLGNVYIVGCSFANTASALGFPLLNAGGYFQGLNTCGQGGFNPMYDSFITKFNFNGVMVWSTMFGSNLPCTQNYDEIFDVACNSFNAVYVVGSGLNQSPGGNFNFKQYGNGYINTNYTLQYTGFIARFTAATKLEWATFVPNLFETGVVVDANNNVFTIGYGGGPPLQNFTAHSSSAYPNAYKHNIFGVGDFDATILAFNNNTHRIWWTYFGSSGASDFGMGCDISELNGKFYICGRTEANGTTAPNNFPFVPGGYFNSSFSLTPNSVGMIKHGWVAGFNGDFSQSWATYFSGNGQDEAVKVSAHRGGNILLCGNTTAPQTGTISFPLSNPGTPFFYDGISANARTEPYIAMFAENANELFWSTYYGTNGSDETSSDIEVGGPYIVWTGNTSNTPSPSNISILTEVPTSWQQPVIGLNDGIIAKFNAPSNIRIGQFAENSADLDNFVILPNLTEQSITILNNSSDVSKKEVEVTLVDLSGRLIQAIVIRDAINNFSVPEIKTGIYFIHLKWINGSESHKVTFINK